MQAAGNQRVPLETNSRPEYDVVVVGAGFAGLYALYRLRGMGLRVVVYEKGAEVGGTWYWNRYPGAACDIESLEYSYSFSEDLQQEWSWSMRFAQQPEILEYMKYVADRFDLRRDIQLETSVVSAAFDDDTHCWTIRTDRGATVTARYCILATGGLSVPKMPEYPGLDSYRGNLYLTAKWPEARVDFSGQRVGIIGTGSSAIQCIPIIAREAGHLHVFQRTPNFSVPLGNAPMDRDYERLIKANYRDLRRKEYNSNLGIDAMLDPETRAAMDLSPEDREREYELRWNTGGLYFYTSFVDLVTDPAANDTLADFARAKIREKVTDPGVAELLCPKDHPILSKRICADTGYYETYNRDNVTLVDVKATPIREITPKGVRTSGQEYEFDSLVLATGFDAMTGAIAKIDIRGRNGVQLKDKWAGGPRTYLGIMTAGFPNLFVTTGPGSPSVLYNMVLGNEYHVEWISDCIEHLRRTCNTCIDPTIEAENEWVDHVNEVGNRTLFPQANSWYMGANVPGKPRVILPYLGGFKRYKQKCNDVAASGYPGFILESV